jgi:hypothetical protein
VGGRALDNIVGVQRMDLTELMQRTRDLAHMKEHSVWSEPDEIGGPALPSWERAPASVSLSAPVTPVTPVISAGRFACLRCTKFACLHITKFYSKVRYLKVV